MIKNLLSFVKRHENIIEINTKFLFLESDIVASEGFSVHAIDIYYFKSNRAQYIVIDNDFEKAEDFLVFLSYISGIAARENAFRKNKSAKTILIFKRSEDFLLNYDFYLLIPMWIKEKKITEEEYEKNP